MKMIRTKILSVPIFKSNSTIAEQEREGWQLKDAKPYVNQEKEFVLMIFEEIQG